MTKTRAPQTVAAASGIGSDAAYGAVTPPIYLSTTYTFADFEKPRAHDYPRRRSARVEAQGPLT